MARLQSTQSSPSWGTMRLMQTLLLGVIAIAVVALVITHWPKPIDAGLQADRVLGEIARAQ